MNVLGLAASSRDIQRPGFVFRIQWSGLYGLRAYGLGRQGFRLRRWVQVLGVKALKLGFGSHDRA